MPRRNAGVKRSWLSPSGQDVTGAAASGKTGRTKVAGVARRPTAAPAPRVPDQYWMKIARNALCSSAMSRSSSTQIVDDRSGAHGLYDAQEQGGHAVERGRGLDRHRRLPTIASRSSRRSSFPPSSAMTAVCGKVNAIDSVCAAIRTELRGCSAVLVLTASPGSKQETYRGLGRRRYSPPARCGRQRLSRFSSTCTAAVIASVITAKMIRPENTMST